MTTYQFTKTAIINADRRRAALGGKHAGKFLVAVLPIDSNGEFNHEPLKARGYQFGGTDGMGILSKKWFLVVEDESAAEDEVTAICETGI